MVHVRRPGLPVLTVLVAAGLALPGLARPAAPASVAPRPTIALPTPGHTRARRHAARWYDAGHRLEPARRRARSAVCAADDRPAGLPPHRRRSRRPGLGPDRPSADAADLRRPPRPLRRPRPVPQPHRHGPPRLRSGRVPVSRQSPSRSPARPAAPPLRRPRTDRQRLERPPRTVLPTSRTISTPSPPAATPPARTARPR